MNDEQAADADKIKAAELILDRVLGKAPLHVDVGITSDSKFAQMMTSAIVGTEEQAHGGIVDGEVVES